ncbi:hypothetical protein SAMN05421837_12040 [Amycolatopsis pretoriensis]|uniref:Uncharacterized protein n=1 Tax=Amycolatopsis pretoriensis TaxID=218821 RepID=A0A1H5RIY9_9PSEU|nr:hypothetical protein [Amycolatopsis pretoriensis]SEF38316.1 hypothetical protein SAMN05421837_12040 [Amycolatopsis pretoriensis]
MTGEAGFRARLLAEVAAGRSVIEIRPLLVEQLERGVKREDLYQELIDTMLFLRAEGRDDDEDAVADVADLMSNWVLPEYRV